MSLCRSFARFCSIFLLLFGVGLQAEAFRPPGCDSAIIQAALANAAQLSPSLTASAASVAVLGELSSFVSWSSVTSETSQGSARGQKESAPKVSRERVRRMATRKPESHRMQQVTIARERPSTTSQRPSSAIAQLGDPRVPLKPSD